MLSLMVRSDRLRRIGVGAIAECSFPTDLSGKRCKQFYALPSNTFAIETVTWDQYNEAERYWMLMAGYWIQLQWKTKPNLIPLDRDF